MSGNAIGALAYGLVIVLYGLSVRALRREGWPTLRRRVIRGSVRIRVAPGPGSIFHRTRRAS